MAAPPKAHRVQLSYLKADSKALDDNRAQDIATTRALYLCDTEADLPTTTDWPGLSFGSWAFCRDEGTQWKRVDGPPRWVQITGGSGAPSDADYLVGTANAGLSAEIVVGTTPGGELGGTWASPTVDATHSGSAHHAESHTHASHTGIGANDHHAQLHATTHEPGGGDAMAVDAAAGTGSLRTLGSGGTQASAGNHSHAGAGHTIQENSVGLTQRANLNFQDGVVATDDAVNNQTDVNLDYGAAGYPVDTTFAAEADGTAVTVARADHKHAITAPTTGYPANVAAAEADGTSAEVPRADHVHAHGSGYTGGHTDYPGAANSTGTIDLGSEAAVNGAAATFSRSDHSHGLLADTNKFTIGCVFDGGASAPTNGARLAWRAPFACTVTNIRGAIDAGTNAVMNAQIRTAGPPGTDVRADVTYTTTSFVDGGALSATAVAAGNEIALELVSTSGAVTKASLQLDLTRP